MKKIVITEEIIKNYPYKTSKNRPHRPYCHLCANFDMRRFHRQGQTWTNFNAGLLKVGEEAITVKFRNGHIGYYHVDCWNNKHYRWKVENIKQQSVEF